MFKPRAHHSTKTFLVWGCAISVWFCHLQEEVKARKAGQRVVIGAAERVVELEARCSSAEGHLQAILRAAGSAVADLRAAAAPPHGGEGGAKGSVKAPSTRQWR